MKNKKTLLGLLLIVVMLLSTALFVSCKKEENPDTGKGEIYYLYENGELNKSNFIQLKDGKWSDDDNENGTYVVSGTSITIYVEMMGEKEEYAKGTLKDGVLDPFEKLWINKKCSLRKKLFSSKIQISK